MDHNKDLYLKMLLRFKKYNFFIEKINKKFIIKTKENFLLPRPIIKKINEDEYELISTLSISKPIFIYQNKNKDLYWITDSFKEIYDRLINLNLLIFKKDKEFVDFEHHEEGYHNFSFNLFSKNEPNDLLENLIVVLDWSTIKITLNDFFITKSDLNLNNIDIYEAGFLIENWIIKWKNIIKKYQNHLIFNLSGGANTRINTFFIRDFSYINSFSTKSKKNEFDNIIGLLVQHKLNIKEIPCATTIRVGGVVWDNLNGGNIDKLLFNKCKLFLPFVFFELSPQHDMFLYKIKFSQTQLLRKALIVLLCKDLLYMPLNTKQTEELYYITPTDEIKDIIKAWYKTGLKEPKDKNLPYYTYEKEV